MTEITLDEKKLKELLKAAIVEVLQEQKEVLPDLLAETIKEKAIENPVTYAEARNNFDKIYDKAISTRQPIVITREEGESVSVIPTAELNSLMETVYLFQSHENAERLLDALKRAKARTNKPQTAEDLRQEFGLGEEEEKVSA
ncbi:MAG: type II toxin-antitoxin system prevent-host-death family antitoxin [Coleofasciculus sp. S288]|nr:type II toxin-antitoxin system prevent-host-death family antitoxin [Coleofasciculus sp. S288]